ncbi:uncharacterized protein LOC143976215 [Lithobates pipiens]
MEGPPAKPSGMKPLQRKALKDLNRKLVLSSSPLTPGKGKMSDSDEESSLVQKRKAKKVGVHIEDEVRPQNDAQAMTRRLQYSPKPSSRLKVSFFSDLTSGADGEGPESAGVTPNSTNKYFSTPVNSKGEAKRKLSPVMEMDMESNVVQEGDAGQARPMEVAHRSLQGCGAGTALGRSPPKTPQYKSSFAMECQRIVKQIMGSENGCWKSPGKRKAEKLDVSTIDSEPPPYNGMPFKSMLTWEVSQMISSVENSPVSDGTSLFGESLLDLERTDMQLQDFSVSDFSNKGGKELWVNDSVFEGISALSPKKDGECSIKRQKLAQPSFKADMLHCESMKTSNNNCKAASATRTFPHGIITPSTSIMEELVGSNLTRELKCDGSDTLHEGIAPHCPAQEDASKSCVSTTQDIGEVANATQEIESSPQLFQMLNTTEVMEPPQMVCNVTQEIALVSKEDGRVNVHLEIKAASQTSSNPRQQTLSFLGGIDEAASNTWVLEEEPLSSVAAVKGMVASLNVGESLANTTQGLVPQTVNTTLEMVSSHEGCVTDFTQEIVSKQEAFINTTQEMVSNQEGCVLNATQEMVSTQEGCISNTTQEIMNLGCIPNTTQEIMNLGCIPNTTQDIMHLEGCIHNTTQVIMNLEGCIHNTTQEMVLPQEGCIPSATQEIVSNQEVCVTVTTQKMVLNHEGCVPKTTQEISNNDSCILNTTQEIVSNQESCVANTKAIPEPSPITASEILAVHESNRSLNTTQAIRPAPDDSGNATQDIMTQDKGIGKETGNTTVNRTSSAEAIVDSSNPSRRVEVCDGATEDIGFAQDGHVGQNLIFGLESKALSPVMPDGMLKDISRISGVFSTMVNSTGSAMNSTEAIKDHITSPNVAPMSVPTFDIKESRNLPGSSRDSRNISGCADSPEDPMIPNKADTINIGHAEDHISVCDVTHAGHTPENVLMIPNKAADLIGTHAEDLIPVSDGTHADLETLVGTSTQGRPDGQENSGNKKGSDNPTAYYFLNEVPPSKGRFLASESFSIIQEEENVHDVSVFSTGSLSFVTSTPVPGLNHFPFQKSEPQNPNVSLGCVMEPPHKDPTEDCVSMQSKLMAPTGGNAGHKPQNKGVPGLPTSTQGTALGSQMSGIPTARRALALFHNPTGVKEPMLSKIPPRGIPGRGSIRPPLARPGLPRPNVGNTKQNMEEKTGIMAPSKLVGSSLKTLKAAAAKPRSTALPSKLPGAPTHPPSQLCTPSSGGLAATQNVTTYVQDPAPDVSTVPSTGIKSFLKPGGSALQPLLPLSSQKSFIRPRSNLPGLPGRKMQLPLLPSQRKIVPVKGEGPPVKKTAKPPVSATLTANTRDSVFKGAGKPNITTSRTQLMRAEPSGESSNHPLPVTDTAEDFCNLETCKCCHLWSEKIRNLLREIEELRRQYGAEPHGNNG